MWRKVFSIFLITFLIFAIVAMVCFIVGLFLSEYIILTISVVCGLASFVLGFFAYNYEGTLKPKTKVIEENPPEKVDEAEYEQRIRDFINH